MALEKNPEFLQAFGNRVKQLRQAKGLSMRALADTLNIDVNQISWIERAKMNTSVLMAYSLAKVLEVPLTELFDFEVENWSSFGHPLALDDARFFYLGNGPFREHAISLLQDN